LHGEGRLALIAASPLDDLRPNQEARGMSALAYLILRVIDLYIWVIIISAILSWLVAFNVINTQNRFVHTAVDILWRLTEPALRPIRSVLPNLGGIDISPVIVILVLLFIRDLIVEYVLQPAVGF
jgi:YggT family protein